MDKVISIEGAGKIVTATSEHAERMYPYMRKADQIEIACMGLTPREALLDSLKNDDKTFTALDAEGVPVAMFGVGKADPNHAYIWCLGTDGLLENSYDFLKASRKWTQQLTKPYGITFNFVHEGNKAAIKWLKFCGAIFVRKLTFSNHPFFEFIILSK